LGQLFTSASERARIDTLRAGTQPQQETAAASAPAAHIVVNGTLQGSDGKRLVWLNGSAVNPSDSSDMALLGDGRVELSWRDGKRKVKPGQGLDQASGEIFEHQTPAPVAAAKEPEATAKPDGAATIPEATVTATVDSTSAVPGPETKPK
ncbi:MAG: hypothetical protein KKA36_04850, partial [Gammaproteobacteria bacterium]|nr:hypothetical protein [Gammaproteobacteria bacterium]